MSVERDARFWDRSSLRYAGVQVGDADGYERTLKRTRVHLQPGADVLELGCGTGTTALWLADGVRRYLATDLSPRMIALAEEKLVARPTPALSFRVATAEDLAVEDDRFDVVLGFNYLHLVRDLPGTLIDINRLLKPRGLFITKTPCLGDMNPLIGQLLLPAMRLFGMAPHASCVTSPELEQLLIDAGFDIVVIENHASNGNDKRPYIVACIK